jgi:hypothetical protein
LPLSLLRPEAMFRSVRANLGETGRLLMANHSLAEYEIAAGYASAAGLKRAHALDRPRLLDAAAPAVVLSLWQPEH